MTTKVEQASTIEPHHGQSTVTAKASAASTSSPKLSMFAAKSGFVIPKNKLSGSLVPIFRGGKKPGGSDAANEENGKQVQRKTKWGPDPTQDPAVRKGRALAYQTRVDQITKQLDNGILGITGDQDSSIAAEIQDHESSVHQVKSEKSELLELERREAIGEILKLNPSYKAPPDYKPVLKEAKVSIPMKEYPGYNFISLIIGPARDTQKRLEKETGAKIRVYGTKADTGEKGEVIPNDGNETNGAYEELYVNISADTYEKVDAAAALIELLITTVSVNPPAVSTTLTSVSVDNVNAVDQSQGISTPPAAVKQEAAQSILGSAQSPQGQVQPHASPWFPAGPPPIRPSSGFFFPPNPSVPTLSNPVQTSAPFTASHMPSLFGPRPLFQAGSGSISQNPSIVPSRPQPPLLQRPFMPQPPFGHAGPIRNPAIQASQPSPAQPSISAPPPFTVNQPPPLVRPLGPSMSQHLSRPTSGSLPDRPLTPAGCSSQWSQALPATPSLGPGSMAQMARPVGPPQGPHPATSQPIIASGVPVSNIPNMNMASQLSFPPRSSAPNFSSTVGNLPIAGSAFMSAPQPQPGLPPPSSFGPNQLPTPTSGLRPIQSSLPPPPSQGGIPSPVSGSAPVFTPVKPPALTTPKPQHPNSNDFTFQPHRPQNLASEGFPMAGIQNLTSPNLTAQTQSFHPAIHSSSPQPIAQGMPRLHISNQMNQTHRTIPPFTGNPTLNAALLRHPAFPHPNPAAPSSSVPQMGPRNLIPATHMANMGRPFLPRPGNAVQLQQNYPSGRPASSTGTQQIYDPFSPTSISNAPVQGGNPAKMKQENDPEYEDLMASVGVK